MGRKRAISLCVCALLLVSPSAYSGEHKLDADDRSFMAAMNDYCKQDTEDVYGSDKMSFEEKKELGHKIVSSFLTFRKLHPKLAAKYEDCIGRTWRAMKERGLD